MILDDIKVFCYFLKYELWNRKAIRYYHELQKQQYLSIDELENINWQKRKSLISYACNKVPYYKKRFKSIGLNPEDIVHPEDYCKVPLLTKDDIRENFDQMISEEAGPGTLRLSTTGGSTGEPLKIMFDKRVPLESLGWRHRGWWGVPPGLNEASVIRRTRERRIDNLVNNILWWPTVRVKLDASSMKIQDVEAFLKRFNRVRPKLIWGYVGAIDHVASFIEENSYNVIPPKAIWVTSSPLSEVQRKRIEKSFRAPVYEQYGCGEVFSISAQCIRREALHIFYDARFIEFIDDSGCSQPVGNIGDIAITDLENYFFPIIRYVNGDMGRALPGKCPCGINLPIMDKVRGRRTDLIKLPNGTCLAEGVTTIFDNFPDAVKAFQVRQAGDYSIKLLYVPNPDADKLSEVLEKVYNKLLESTESQVPITLEAVGAIPHDRGKLRYVISELTC